jgi:hypothetical protein
MTTHIPSKAPIILSNDATVMVGGTRYLRFLLKTYGRTATMGSVIKQERTRLEAK